MSHSAGKNCRGNLLGFHLILRIEKIYALEGYIMIFCREFSVSQCREKSYRNLPVFHSFGYPKMLGIRGVGHDILSKNLCLTVPEKIVEGIF